MKTWEGLEEIVLRIENSNARAVTFRARRFNRSTRPTHFCHKIRLPADQQLRGGGIILPIGLRLVTDIVKALTVRGCRIIYFVASSSINMMQRQNPPTGYRGER